MRSKDFSNICIIGGGMVGLSLAYQIIQRHPKLSISIIDKENKIGMHTSGRNSGVLHAGIYYEPGSLKSKVCVSGAKRLKKWCQEQELPILECGKVITPQKEELDNQIDILYERGKANGADVKIINNEEFNRIVPDGYSSTGRALWTPNTCVVNPLQVITKLKNKIVEAGVNIHYSEKDWKVIDFNNIRLSSGKNVYFDFLFNCAGLQSDLVAKKFGVAKNFTMLPFKGSYWELKKNTPFNFNTNLYPVPDLEVPFLGVHVTPGFGGKTYLGPTATPAAGRENYSFLKNIEIKTSAELLFHMSNQFLLDRKMRRYIFDQAFEWMPNKFFKAAKSIIPKLKKDHIQKSKKIGIRPQLYDINKKELVQDFLIIEEKNTSHIVNAISPAFTASFALADNIVDNSKFF